jgi:Cu/Ag efflux protein CusF
MTKRSLVLVAASVLGVGACGYVPVVYAADAAQEQREPGGTATVGLSATATVKAIDPATRTVTLTSAEGEDVEVKCGKRVRNFDQLKVGDQVRAAVFARLVVAMGKDDEALAQGGDATTIIRTPEGDKPGTMIVRTQQRTAKIESIDPTKRTVTLSGLEDQPRQVPIGKDVDLEKLKAGDEATVRVTRGLAIWVPQSEGARPAAGRIPGAGEGEGGTATVTAVDPAKGTVTLMGAQGKEREIELRPGSENIERLKVGDKVRATIVPEMAIAVRKAGGAGAAQPERPGMAAVEGRGGRPGLLLADTDELKGRIESVDATKHTITITEADGDSRTIRTAPRVELSELKTGDEVTARITQPVAIKVEHQ